MNKIISSVPQDEKSALDDINTSQDDTQSSLDQQKTVRRLEQNETPPKVFISYSQDSPEHEDRVLAFSTRLRADGIDCNLDQYEISPPEGWPRWMDRQIHEADFVLLICTPTYFRRVMGQEQPGKGHGVSWESTLIYQYIYNAGTMNIKFIPVLFEGASISDIPTPLQGASHYSAFIEASYKDLCHRLRNLPRAVKPPLGENQAPSKVQQLPLREREHSFSREAHNEQIKAEVTDSSVSNLQDNSHTANYHPDNITAILDPLQMFKDTVDLRDAMHNALSQAEFKLLCANLGVRYDDLEGENLEVKMQTLIDYFYRRKRYRELVQRVLQFRPDLANREDS